MVCQYREFQSQLDDVERLWLYAQSSVSKHQALDASLAKEESKAKHWKRETRAGEEKIELVEKERDKAKQEVKAARLAAIATGEAKARAKDNLAKMRDALAVVEKDKQGLEI